MSAKNISISQIEAEFLGTTISHILEICEKIPKDVQKEFLNSKKNRKYGELKFTFDDFINLYYKYKENNDG